MTFIEKLREEIIAKKKYIFTTDELTSFTKDELSRNSISNYDYKNEGSKNTNKKVLDSIKIENKTYYSFRNLEECK